MANENVKPDPQKGLNPKKDSSRVKAEGSDLVQEAISFARRNTDQRTAMIIGAVIFGFVVAAVTAKALTREPDTRHKLRRKLDQLLEKLSEHYA